jgi:hypothetical protein
MESEIENEQMARLRAKARKLMARDYPEMTRFPLNGNGAR